MQSSLSTRILIKVGLAVGCCVVLFGIAEFYQTRFQLQKELDHTLLESGRRLGNALAMPMWNVDKGVVESIVRTEMQNKDIEAVLVRDSLAAEIIVAMGRNDTWQIIDLNETDNLKVGRTAGIPISLNGEKLGSVNIFVTDRFSGSTLVKTVVWLTFRLLVLLLLVLAVLIYFIDTMISKPIQQLRLDCRKLTEGDFLTELDTSREDEIGSLARSFANMRDSIKDNITTLNQEIHERKTSEAELQYLRTYLSDMVDSMPSMLVSVDKNNIINQWNNEAEKITGVSRSAAHSRLLYEVLPGMAEMTKLVEEALDKGRASKESRCSLPIDGVRRLVDVTIYPLRLKGSEGAVIRLDDITEKVRLEEVMVQTEKMMSVGGLAAGMAHEINNPLAGIMQSAQVIQTRFSPELEKNRQAANQCNISMEELNCYLQKRDIFIMIDSILESGSRAARIITNMLSFSRKGSSQHLPCVISELLDKTVELAANDYDLKKKFDFRRIKVIREYDPTVQQVRCDESAVQQVFFNMLKNAAQAMIPGASDVNPEVAVPEPTLRLRIYEHQEWLCIDFTDNGAGMDEETVKRIFEPFFSTKSVGVGTGLGLSVSYFIIKENHQGSISVASQPGVGTTFTISLPRSQE
ncbi:MAG: ATP-binding protein [Desulfocapsaceae bacterium]|nr:ATP-binding protein [Desulfocapsaceae bacterium]